MKKRPNANSRKIIDKQPFETHLRTAETINTETNMAAIEQKETHMTSSACIVASGPLAEAKTNIERSFDNNGCCIKKPPFKSGHYVFYKK